MSDTDAKLAELAARFAARVPMERSALASAIVTGDRHAIAGLAHKLSGIAGMFGHAGISDAARELELSAERGDDFAAEARHLDRCLSALEGGR